MYNFIELECPNCKHIFVWQEHTFKGTAWKLYSRKGYDEMLESTICPKCGMEIAVLNDSHTGIDIHDKSIEVVANVRGI